jgi:broad specificity phosphatase PhoE
MIMRTMTVEGRLLFLVRHGASEANLRLPYRLQGCGTDLPLCSLGQRQARAVADLLRGYSLRWAYSSSLQRAFETAQIIAAPHDIAVEKAHDLTECDAGSWEGLSWGEIEAQDPERCAAFKLNPGEVGYPNGESFTDVARRAIPAVQSILDKHAAGNGLIVWHAAVGQVYVGELLGLPAARARDIEWHTGGVTIVDVNQPRPKLLTLNATFHLDGIV